MKGTMNEIPLTDLTTPKAGYVCMLDHFWLIGPNGGALSYDVPRSRMHGPQVDRYPQANTHELLVKRWAEKGHAGAVGYQKVPVAFWPQVRD